MFRLERTKQNKTKNQITFHAPFLKKPIKNVFHNKKSKPRTKKIWDPGNRKSNTEER